MSRWRWPPDGSSSRAYASTARSLRRLVRWGCTALICTWSCVGSVSAGTATLSWTPPTQNTDGTPLVDLASYRAYWRCGAGSGYPQSVTIPAPASGRTIEGLTDGSTCYFVVTALNSAGAESARSSEASKSFAGSPPANPTSGPVITWSVAPMAITVDDTVARWTGTPNSTGTVVSASFTPPNGSLLVVCINVDENPNANPVTPSGGGHTYTERVARGQSDATEGLAAIWTAPVVTGASMTVTLTRSGGDVTNRRVSGKVYIVTGQHASPIGANGETDWSTNNQTTSLTATGAGRLFGCGTDWSALGAPTSTDTEDAAHYAGEISVMSAYKSADHASGTQGINFDAATGTPSGNVVILEILAAAGASASSLVVPPRTFAALLQH